MQWKDFLQAAETNLVPVERGFTHARRGIVTLPGSKERYFVKIAVDAQTKEWVEKEIRAYDWLEAHGYPHAPRLVARGEDGFALPDLSAWDWRSAWNPSKLDAALRAMDDLAALAGGEEEFTGGIFADNPWEDLGDTISWSHIPGLTPDMERAANALLQPDARQRYTQIAAAMPFRGKELVHADVRADNFAYDPSSGEGLLVDWNWLRLGSRKFDQTVFLVDVHKRFDVFDNGYANRFDMPSLIWLMGFWLYEASGVPDMPHLARLRFFQMESALRAQGIYEKLAASPTAS